ncbi:hypothetical protein BASH2_04919 [Bacillus anthracis]|nr:hypothetical protein BASH2_04919 [Bacillus anthracis]
MFGLNEPTAFMWTPFCSFSEKTGVDAFVVVTMMSASLIASFAFL